MRLAAQSAEEAANPVADSAEDDDTPTIRAIGIEGIDGIIGGIEVSMETINPGMVRLHEPLEDGIIAPHTEPVPA